MRRVREQDVKGIVEHFEELPDPRETVNRLHLLVDVIVLSICGVLAGADGPSGIAEWARLNQEWLVKYLKLPNGIPSHDTIGRVLQALDPRAFQECFAAWLETLPLDSDDVQAGEPEHYAIDGKTLRRSHDRQANLKPLHLLSVWATERGLTLGQISTGEKAGESRVIPHLLERVNVEGAVVSIDAAGCQKHIAQAITDGGGDYLLALKGNQGTLHRSVREWFEQCLKDDFAGVPVSRVETESKAHGREEHHTYYQTRVPEDLKGIKGWSKLNTIGMALRVCQMEGREQREARFFISSLRRNGKRFARIVRNHWAIENTLHWSLDVTFREDDSRIRGRNVAENIAWLRRLALSLIKKHPGKQSMAMKRRMAGWSPQFLMQILTGKTI